MSAIPEDHRPHETPEVLDAIAFAPPQTLLAASLGFALLLVLAFIVLGRKKSKSRGNALLLVGPMDSGKTAIFSRLAYAQTLPTHTSLQANASDISLTPSKTIRIIDIPGHPRIRNQFTDHLSSAKAIAFVVDSNSVSRTGPAVAEHLHHILHALTSLPPSQTPPLLTILCNKSDLLKTSTTSGPASSLATNRVKTILERELEKRRVAQSASVGVEGLGEENSEQTGELGGLECGSDGNATFRFEDWEGGEVVFLGTSVRPESEKASEVSEKDEPDAGLIALENWLEDNM
ncbi:signal recognition particle receptor beta subunit-domain-containing protein [Ephemerocybe angulata]|uniref:Signal recognition particle receptor subunit beta n=1 Tax=Ephemerocybe angulata TaxID=980116 RepID=A0A8H6IGQ0_9AGAR|nr:signal recognition particle receptor beta subunit-domain-containing protein [Tulosesus angulatus]